MKKRLNLLAAFSIFTASAVALSGCGSDKPVGAAEAQIPSVKVISLQSLTSQGVIGKVAVNETIQLYSKLSGRIASVNAEEGAKVKKGDVLVQLETTEIAEQVKQAQANLDAANARLADALAGTRAEDIRAAQGALDAAKASADQTQAAFDLVQQSYNQAKNHYDNGDIGKDDMNKITADYKRAKATYEQAIAGVASAQAKLDELKAGATSSTIDALKAGVDSSQATLNLAQLSLQNAAIVSPIDGIVVKKLANTGEMAFTMMPAGTSLMELVSIDPVKVEVSVPERLLNQLKEGATVDVKIPSLPDKNFQGRVSFISPVSDPNNNTFSVKLTVQNPDYLLRAGTVANVYFAGNDQKRMELPKSALITKDGKTVVFKLDGDTVHQVSIQTEEKNQEWAYLKEGSSLKDNDKIVISPNDKLADGIKVHVE